MARKSRKATQQLCEPESKQRIFNAALYVRLSNEERFNRANKNSFKTQKALLFDFVEKHPDINVYKVYEDNGYTGTNFDRPGFSDMMYDVSNEKVDCIIVKDLSRFGREHIEMGKYLDYLFPIIGLRFIAINDNYDTYDKIKDNDMIVPFKNIINTMYAKDISKKVIASKRIREQKGISMAGVAPYGYKFDENRNLIIDEEVAPNVLRIFKEYSEGSSFLAICKGLTYDGIDTPKNYKYKKGIIKSSNNLGDNLWKVQPLISLITNPVYAGNITNGRSRSMFCETGEKKRRITDRKEWVIVNNTHQGIVSQELFDAVQEKYYSEKKKCKRRKNVSNLLVSKIKCGECGHIMHVVKSYSEKSGHYHCTLRDFYKDKCDNHSHKINEINDIVLKSIKQFTAAAIDFADISKECSNDYQLRRKRQNLENNVKNLNSELKTIKQQRFELFNDCLNSIIDADEFKYARVTYSEKVSALELQLKNASEELTKFKRMLEPQEWMDKFKTYRKSRTLSKEMVDYFVDKVFVYKDNRVEIKWNFAVEELLKGDK